MTGEFECGGEEKTRSLKNGACLKKEKSTIKKLGKIFGQMEKYT